MTIGSNVHALKIFPSWSKTSQVVMQRHRASVYSSNFELRSCDLAKIDRRHLCLPLLRGYRRRSRCERMYVEAVQHASWLCTIPRWIPKETSLSAVRSSSPPESWIFMTFA